MDHDLVWLTQVIKRTLLSPHTVNMIELLQVYSPLSSKKILYPPPPPSPPPPPVTQFLDGLNSLPFNKRGGGPTMILVKKISIDRSEPRFNSHIGGKIRKTLKNGGDFNVF